MACLTAMMYIMFKRTKMSTGVENNNRDVAPYVSNFVSDIIFWCLHYWTKNDKRVNGYG